MKVVPRANFEGRVEKRSESDWRIRVEGIEKAHLECVARDFPNDDLSHGRELRGFRYCLQLYWAHC